MSFKDRYLTEEMVPTEALNNVLNPNYKQAPGNIQKAPKVNAGPTQVDNTAPLSAESITNASKPGTQSINDLQSAKRTAETMHKEARRDNSSTPQTPTPSTPQTPTPSISLSEVTNPLTQRLEDAGIKTGVEENKLKKLVKDSKQEAHSAGTKNINSGTHASFTLARHDAKRQANDGLKSGMNSGDIARSTTLTTENIIFKINNLLEENDIDPKWGTHAPGSKVKTVIMKKGVQPVNHTQATHKMIDDMHNVIETKQKRRNLVRRETMPETYKPPAATQTMGLHMNDANVRSKYREPEARAKEINAQARAQREERLSGGQQNG